MSKLIIFCNAKRHADVLVIEPLNLNPKDCIIISDINSLEKLHGYKDFSYYAIRPLFARELQYVKSHGGKEVTLDELRSQEQTT